MFVTAAMQADPEGSARTGTVHALRRSRTVGAAASRSGRRRVETPENRLRRKPRLAGVRQAAPRAAGRRRCIPGRRRSSRRRELDRHIELHAGNRDRPWRRFRAWHGSLSRTGRHERDPDRTGTRRRRGRSRCRGRASPGHGAEKRLSAGRMQLAPSSAQSSAQSSASWRLPSSAVLVPDARRRNFNQARPSIIRT